MTADAVGGVWTYALALAAELGRAGIEVHLAVMGPSPDLVACAHAAAVPGLRVYARPFKLEWMEDAERDVARAGRWLLSMEEKLAPDVVHLNGYAHAALPFAAPKVVVAHSCVLTWWRAVHGVEAPASCTTYARAVARGLAAADHVVAPSRAMLSALDETYGPRGAPSTVIPNGLPLAPEPSVEKRDVILSAGRLWDRGKNVEAVIAVAPALPWPVWLAGEEALEGRAASSEEEGVRRLGRLSSAAMAAAYETASIYALPARYEPFGLSILEAAQRGCALVLGDIPSLRENWEGAARFVAPEDGEALAAALRELAGDARARAALARAAARRAERFTARAMGAATLEIYAGLVRARATKEVGRACGS
jgi:glycosyltransferase involved in cell wall biosynthesis